MTRRLSIGAEAFIDTSYAIALANSRDDLHHQAFRLSELLEKNKTNLITTQAVVLEIGNALSKQRYRLGAIKLLQALESDPKVEVVPLSQQIYTKAIQLYSERLDKEWGLIDCVSFVVMQEREIADALTADEHFQQAGFRALLRETF